MCILRIGNSTILYNMSDKIIGATEISAISKGERGG